jgi:uncharacterized protein (TIRG00374 family)
MTLEMWKKQALIITGTIIGLGLIAKIFSEIPVRDILDLVTHSKPWALAAFIIISVSMMIIHSYRWKIIIKAQTKKNISLYKLFQYYTVGFGISFITPAAKVGGEPVRAAMLKKHNITFRKAINTVGLDKIIDMSVMGLLFSIAIAIVLFTLTLPQTLFYSFMILGVIFITLVGYIYYHLFTQQEVFLKLFKLFRLHKIKKLKKIEEQLMDFEETIIQFHKTKKRAFYRSILLSTINWILMFIEYISVLALFGITNVGLSGIFLIITFMGAAYLFPVPLALGFLEAGQLAIFKTLNLPLAAAVGLSMIIRFRDLLWTMFSGIFLLNHGFKFKKIYKKIVKDTPVIPLEKKENISILKKDFSEKELKK